MASTESEQKELRAALETADRELVALVQRRAELAMKLGALREADGDGPSPRPVPPQLVQQALDGARGPLAREVLAKIVRTVATACAPLLEPARIAFAGSPGDEAHNAARLRFGDGAPLVQTANVEAALAEVSAGRAVFAVAPYERKPHGIVDETVQALLASELHVLACFDARAGAPESDRSGADEAPPPTLPGDLRAVEVARYAVIGARPTRRSGEDRTALVFTLPDDGPGALHEVLRAFKESDVNLTHIQSRPGQLGDPRHGGTSHGGWSYLFFVELLGHVTDRAVITALDGARRASKYLRVLGSFARE